jgi:hypothetical protein
MNTQQTVQPAAQAARRLALSIIAAGALLSAALLQPANAAPLQRARSQAATPITGGTSFGTAVALTTNTEYSSILNAAQPKHFFELTVNPGAIVTVSATSAVTFTSGSAYIYMDDQLHVSYLKYLTLSGAEQAASMTYIGDSTTPTKYYIRAEGSTSATANQHIGFKVTVTDQADGGQPFDAPETAVLARAITPTLGTTTAFQGMSGGIDDDDYYRIAAVSGQQISVSIHMLDHGPTPSLHYLYLYDAANPTSYLSYETLNAGDNGFKTLNHMANNATPTAYLVRVQRSGSSATPDQYELLVATSQQADGNVAGDAGDTFDSAKVISPELTAVTNRLGFADEFDYFQIDLPIDPSTGANAGKPYKMVLSVADWQAATGGSLSIAVYNAARTQVGATQFIAAPTTAPITLELRDCDLCFVRVSKTTSKPLVYRFTLAAPNQIFMPLIKR